MNSFQKYQEGQEFTVEVKNSVRYGYLYRRESEKNLSSHACLGEVHDILYWMASAIAGGFVWDVVKSLRNRMLQKCRKSNFFQNVFLKSVLTDEQEFRLFYDYIKEYNNNCMSITEEQFKYIREEIIADYYGKECEKVMKSDNRLPTTEEYMRINREANAYADTIMKPIV